jgi:predicted histone-like DNA-binding protein
MAVRYFKYKRKITKDSVSEYKYMPQMQLESEVGFEQIAEMIQQKSTMSRGDIMGVLAELEPSISVMLENGHPVNLGLIGTFIPGIEVVTVDDPKDVTHRLIKRFKVLFKPSMYFKNRFKNVNYELADNVVRVTNHKNSME